MNFDAIFKNVKIIKIGLLEAKLWKISEFSYLRNKGLSIPYSTWNTELINSVFYVEYGIDQSRISMNFPTVIWQIFHNFASSGPILKIFTFLKMALKFICSFSLHEECGIKNKAATAYDW